MTDRTDEINKLTLTDKLSLIEDVWDSIAQSHSTLPMHEWQKKELDQRYSDYKAGKQSLHDWNSVHDELLN
ncbi:MAG: addiction module protein [Desulfobacteraceae bacterium]|jgi:putative addiction module component (TIGR02574 family)